MLCTPYPAAVEVQCCPRGDQIVDGFHVQNPGAKVKGGNGSLKILAHIADVQATV